MISFRLWVMKLACVVGLASTITTGAVAPNAHAQIIDQAYVNVPYEKQDTIVWCWAAVARMVARYYNVAAPSQCSMLEARYGLPCCNNPGNICTQIGSIWQIQDLIQGFGLQTSSLGPPSNGWALLNIFKSGRPVVIHLVQGHFVVAAGMRVIATPQGPLGIVRILDPYYGVSDIPLPQLYAQWDVALYIH